MTDEAMSDANKTIVFIKEVVAAYYNVNKDIYENKSRKQINVKVKHVAIYIVRKETKLSTIFIGKAFNVDHATVIYIQKKFDGYLEWDNDFKNEIKEIDNILKFKIADELNLAKDYYYIPLNEFVSIKHENGKAIILKGFTEKEIESIKFVDSRSGKEFFEDLKKARKHQNQKFYILEKNEKNNN